MTCFSIAALIVCVVEVQISTLMHIKYKTGNGRLIAKSPIFTYMNHLLTLIFAGKFSVCTSHNINFVTENF